ncbi:TPA: hypothetical protein EYP44_01400 [Candidatus Bathyarchaeota archaeon]|nr:hypothetical protein [Candidatus Bathyarchaeota archaeon]
MREKAKPRKVDLWTARRMSRVAILGALTGALAFIPVPVMPGMTLDPAIPAFAAFYYGPFEGYWSYVVGQLIRYGIQTPDVLVINPMSIFMGTPCVMMVAAWVVRMVDIRGTLLPESYLLSLITRS